MDFNALVSSLKDCPCGRKHECDIKCVSIGSGLLEKTAEILSENGFPKNILLIADKNTIAAADGIEDILRDGGFSIKEYLFDDLREANEKTVEFIEELCKETDGILSVGTGSLNDVCRLASKRQDKEFAIFATAPSMDGFASGTSPITTGYFKHTVEAKQPSVIIADTKILAASPAILKGSGYGDVMGKYIAMVDWRIASLLTGEYYCDNIANITRGAVRKMVALTDRISSNDEEAAGSVMEALVLTGMAMKLGDTVRAASGAEHIISHYWEMKKLEKGLISDFHGRKVAVATLICAKEYERIAACNNPRFHEDDTDWDDVYRVVGKNLENDVRRLNNPTCTEGITPEMLEESFEAIRTIIREELPSSQELERLMKLAGTPTECNEIAVDDELRAEGIKYHPYLRHRLTLMRLKSMIDA